MDAPHPVVLLGLGDLALLGREHGHQALQGPQADVPARRDADVAVAHGEKIARYHWRVGGAGAHYFGDTDF